MIEVVRAERAVAGPARHRNLDALRAVAALAVLFGHAYLLSGRTPPVVAEFTTDAVLASTATGVWLFFAISGFVITRPYVRALLDGSPLPPLLGYVVRRTVRIFPLYWIALVAAILLVGTQGAAAWELVAHAALLHNLAPGRQAAILSVAWTLTLELLFYAAVPIVAAVVRRARPLPTADALAAGVLVIWALSVGWTAAADLLIESPRGSLFARQLFPSMVAMFCPGILLAIGLHAGRGSRVGRAVAAIGNRRAPATVAGCGLVVLGSCAAFLEVGGSIQRFLLAYDAARVPFAVGYGLLVAVAVTAPTRATSASRPLWRLGDASYGIYLLHAVVLLLLLEHPSLVLLEGRGGGLAYLVHVVQLLVITVPLALVSWNLFERPLMQRAARAAPR